MFTIGTDYNKTTMKYIEVDDDGNGGSSKVNLAVVVVLVVIYG